MANNPKAADNLKPFVKGDPRINRKGKPKSFGELRELAQSIAHEPATMAGHIDKEGKLIPGGPIIINGHIATVAEMIIRQWAQSKDPRLVQAFIAYGFGKPPEQVQNLNVDVSELTDDQIDRLLKGESLPNVIKHT